MQAVAEHSPREVEHLEGDDKPQVYIVVDPSLICFRSRGFARWPNVAESADRTSQAYEAR